MISARLGHFFDRPLSPIARSIKVDPNYLSVAGFIVTTIAALAITLNLKLGGILIIIGGMFDVLDGAVARINGKVSDFGAYLDSVLDRYADAFIFSGIAVFFARENNLIGIALCIGTMIGAMLTSYARARAEGIGVECRTGLVERPERIMMIVLGTLTGWMIEVLWVMFFLSHITVVQRIFYVRKQKQAAGSLPD